MASYLENYARHFQLPIATGERVTRITRHSGEMVVECGGSFRYARNVVVATGAYSLPKIPDFAGLLNPTIEQFHSSTYLRPQDVAQGSVLVVGFGTSGVDVATELALSGRPNYNFLDFPHKSL
jgi:putative flavoprotein involved in K+ transport